MKKGFALFSIICIGLLFIFVSGEDQKTGSIKLQDLKGKTQEIQIGAAVQPDLNFGKFPLYFISNKGQVDKTAKFYAKASRYTLWLTKDGLVFDSVIRGKGSGVRGKKEKTKEGAKRPSLPLTPDPLPLISRDVSRLMFVGANKNPEMVPLNETKLKVNYFKGNDKSKWHTGIPASGAVLYKNLYKNIDLKVYGLEKKIEYDWIVNPGGNPGDIRFEYKNVKGTRLDESGNLLIETDFGELVHKRPVSYQETGTGRMAVDVQFKRIGENAYGFKVGRYDCRFTLTIDPVVLAYSTYMGGTTGPDYGYGIAVDNNGYVYITGDTYNEDFPTLNQYMTDPGDYTCDAFVTKLDPTQSGASSLLYSTYLGGGVDDIARKIAVDDNGCVYVVGKTWSSDFPTKNHYQTYLGYTNGFVTKLDTTQNGTSSLIYSTYLGIGSSSENGYGIAVDNNGYVYVAGTGPSDVFPILNQFQTCEGSDGFLIKLDTTQSGVSSILYSTCLVTGGGGITVWGLAASDNGYAYMTGSIFTSNLTLLNQYQTYQGSHDAFVMVLDTTQSGASCLIYSTYLGGNEYDEAHGIAVDNNGYVYVAGGTSSSNFPLLNQYQASQGGCGFVTKLDITQSGTSGLLYSTHLSGEPIAGAYGIAVDNSGCAYVTGVTNSWNFPTLNSYQTYQGGDLDACVVKVDTTRSGTASLVCSTYLGGSGLDRATRIAIDGSGSAYVVGITESLDFPTYNQYQGPLLGENVFVTKLILPPIAVISPNSGENWKIGSTQDIIWHTKDVPGDLKITLWKDGSSVGIITDNLDPAAGSFTWTVGEHSGGTAAPGTGYTVKIKEKGTAVSDIGDASFTISPSLTVTSPNGDETWPSGANQTITWDSQCVSGDLKITLWKDGVSIGIIGDNIDPASGSFSWTMGQYNGGFASVGTGYIVKIKEIGTAVADVSDASFTISPSLTVTSPNGGESWQIGSTQNITWNAQGVSANLKITLWKDSISLGIIGDNINFASGSLPWTVGQYIGGTAPAGSGYTIKIKEKGTTISDVSDNAFDLH